MLSVIEDIPASTPITFPVDVSKLSFHPLALLISLERDTSLTLWSRASHAVSYREVILLRRAFPGKLFLDLPIDQAAELERELLTSENVSLTSAIESHTMVSISESTQFHNQDLSNRCRYHLGSPSFGRR